MCSDGALSLNEHAMSDREIGPLTTGMAQEKFHMLSADFLRIMEMSSAVQFDFMSSLKERFVIQESFLG